jgi:hypothetical protein
MQTSIDQSCYHSHDTSVSVTGMSKDLLQNLKAIELRNRMFDDDPIVANNLVERFLCLAEGMIASGRRAVGLCKVARVESVRKSSAGRRSLCPT